MAGFSTFIIFTSVLCQLPVTATSGPLKEVVGALGGSVTFTVSFPEKQIDTVIWTFNTFTVAIVNKDNAKVLQNPKKEKILFPDGSYSMKLSQLKKNDSGVYRAEIHSTSLQSPFTQEYVLYVYETLSAPKVTTDEQPSKNGSCTTKLTCSVEEEGDNVTYSWKAIGQGAHELHDGAILPISWKLGEKEKTLICMARNPISHSSSNPVLARNLCEDTANLDKSSPRFILYTLPVAIVFSLTLIIAFAVRTEKGKGKACVVCFCFCFFTSFFSPFYSSCNTSIKHTLFHCADPQSSEESQLPACRATYVEAIKL
uniref:SLAM family member 7 n=1 Tax=Cricetulus griseus TaxID=10029 RepID=A0A8C2QHQ2_CRIGR